MNNYAAIAVLSLFSCSGVSGQGPPQMATAAPVPVVHCDGQQSDVFWLNIDVDFNVTDSAYPTGSCNEVALGDDINDILEDHGIGPSGAGDDAKYLAEVCHNPVQVNTTRLRRGRRLNGGGGFIYSGGGSCRYCDDDDNDRRLVGAPGAPNPYNDPDWFEDTYQSTLVSALTTRFQTDLIDSGNHTACLGSSPGLLLAVVEVASSSDVNYGCP